jgi:hypothetical protein
LEDAVDYYVGTRVYGWLADITLSLHVIFVVFVIVGQLVIVLGWLRRWRWVRDPRFRLAHVAAIGFVVLESWFGIVCPLTRLEEYLRQRAGLAGYDMSFIGYWLRQLLFYEAPEWLFMVVYSLFGLLVLVTLCTYPPRWRKPFRS